MTNGFGKARFRGLATLLGSSFALVAAFIAALAFSGPALSDNADCEVIVAGGVVRSKDRGIVGEVTMDFIEQFKVDIGLIGISGIESDGTLRDFDYREVKVARAILAHSREVWVAADHSKFNRPAMVELARFDQIETIFTDAPPPDPFPALLAQAPNLHRRLADRKRKRPRQVLHTKRAAYAKANPGNPATHSHKMTVS